MGTRVDLVSRDESIRLINHWITSLGYHNRLVVTAYSEFFVKARSDRAFWMALEGADLVTPDGIGPLASIRYQQMANGKWLMTKILIGLRVGLDILRGRVGEPVSGYWLFGELTRLAARKGYRVFVLGGYGETASLVANKLRIMNHELRIMGDGGAQTQEQMIGEANDRVIEKINKFKPDLLFVAYGPGKQEKWLSANRGKIKAKVAIGVGGTFDEYLGRVKEAPEVFSRYGIKWLWRLLQQPARLPRVFKATFVFAWLVFWENLKSQTTNHKQIAKTK